jgi:NADPH:quinone reductase-like Zn-dependent oxidoreductase
MNEHDSMRALILQEPGGRFQHVRMPRPTPRRGEVLVRIHASGVNPLDLKIRAGAAPHARHPLPAVLGIDLAGVVEALGDGVEAFRVGDAVYGMTGGVGGLQGSLAELAAVDADLLAHKPRNLSLREAAALPLVAITAWEGLVDRAHLQPGQKVLVHGGAGGVGHVAVQMARALGAEVYATGRPEHADVIRRLGATSIDFTTTPVDRYVDAFTAGEGFDVVYDTVGGATLDASFAAARRYGGHVVSCLGWGTHALAPLSFRAATYSGVFTLLPLLTGQRRQQHGRILRETARMVEAGRLAPLMDPHRFDLDAAWRAHQHLAAGHAQGRVVVEGVAA